MVVCCQYERAAQRILRALEKRLAKYRLALNADKTRLVPFSSRAYQQQPQAMAFAFLGFIFYWGRSHKGAVIPKLKTEGKRLRAELKRVGEWARRMRNQEKLLPLWKRFCAKLTGHIAYFGVSFNGRAVQRFLQAAIRILFKWLNRRSQRKSFTWAQFVRFMRAHPLPKVRIYHTLW